MQHQQSTADGYVMVCHYVFKGGIPQFLAIKSSFSLVTNLWMDFWEVEFKKTWIQPEKKKKHTKRLQKKQFLPQKKAYFCSSSNSASSCCCSSSNFWRRSKNFCLRKRSATERHDRWEKVPQRMAGDFWKYWFFIQFSWTCCLIVELFKPFNRLICFMNISTVIITYFAYIDKYFSPSCLFFWSSKKLVIPCFYKIKLYTVSLL